MRQYFERLNRFVKMHWKRVGSVALSLLLLLVLALLFTLRSGERLPVHWDPSPNPYMDQGYYREDGFLRYADAEYTSRKGIDVSAHQGEINWEAVRNSGIEFAILRVGYRGTTEGRLYVDSCFEENYRGAKAAGLAVGAYFFSQAMTVEEAEEEAAYVCAILKNRKLELPLFYDWECVPDSPRTATTSGIPLTACCQAFSSLVEQRGFTPGVYFNLSYAYHDLEMGDLEGGALWLAEYNEIPTYTQLFQFVQFSDHGQVDGISVPVDLDLWILPRETITQEDP